MLNTIRKSIGEKELWQAHWIYQKKVFVLAERLKKKDAPSKLFEASTENMPFLNRNQIFTIYKRAKLNNGSNLYWVEEDGKKLKGRFFRQVLFTLNQQFEKWIQISFTLKKYLLVKIINLH